MFQITIRQLTLILFIPFVIIGCAPNKVYRSVFGVCNVPCGKDGEDYSLQIHNKNKNSEYLLSFVEIDDQGQLRNRRQMTALLKYLSGIAEKESVLINVFVHGWHHNADPEDENVQGFKNILEELSKAQPNSNKRKLVGIYVGWRGESIEAPLVKYLTFWDRKNTAQDVGDLGLTELLLRLEKITHNRNELLPPKKSRLVTIGHSFGGAVVYSATAQILLSRFIESQHDQGYETKQKTPLINANKDGESKSNDQHTDGFGDLVVLLNPAFEALRYAPAFDMAQEGCKGAVAPRLAILTSETDYATGLAFPLGRALNTFFETHDEVNRNECIYPMTLDEGKADRNTVGHYEPLISHRLTPLGSRKGYQILSKGDDKIVWSEQKHGGSIQVGETLLTHLQKSNPRSPYLNIRVDKDLMNGHNDILKPEITHFIASMIHLSTTE